MWPKKKGLSKVNNTENNAIFLLNISLVNKYNPKILNEYGSDLYNNELYFGGSENTTA